MGSHERVARTEQGRRPLDSGLGCAWRSSESPSRFVLVAVDWKSGRRPARAAKFLGRRQGLKAGRPAVKMAVLHMGLKHDGEDAGTERRSGASAP